MKALILLLKSLFKKSTISATIYKRFGKRSYEIQTLEVTKEGTIKNIVNTEYILPPH